MGRTYIYLAPVTAWGALIAVAACSLAHSRAHAATTSWNTNSSGDFTSFATWDNGPPDNDDTAVFDRGFVAYEVNFPASNISPIYQIEYLRVRTNEVSFVWSPAFAPPFLTVLNPDVSIVIGEDAGNVAILNMTLNNLSGAIASIGRAIDAEGTLNVGGTFSMSNTLYIGKSGKGTMNVAAGGRVESLSAFVGYEFSSEGRAAVSGANSRWIVNSPDFAVGNVGKGSLMIQNGGHVSSDDCKIGDLGIGGTVTVDGAGSTWVSSGNLLLGGFASATLAITAGGAVSNVDAVLGQHQGAFGTSGRGTVTVDGLGSTWSNDGNLILGVQGVGTVNITNGGQVSSVQCLLGEFGPSIGVVNIDGAGSTWSASGDFTIGKAGQGNLTITRGGRLNSAQGFISTMGGAIGTVTIDGAGSAWAVSGDMTVGAVRNAMLTVSNGGVAAAIGILSIEAQGTVVGNGALSSTVVNRGLVAPGASIGALHVTGAYIQAAAGKLQIELAGTGTSYDQLQISNSASLNGLLQVLLTNGFTPSIGDEFNILDWGSVSGTFATLQLPALPGGGNGTRRNSTRWASWRWSRLSRPTSTKTATWTEPIL